MKWLEIFFNFSFLFIFLSTVFILSKLSIITYEFPKGDYAGHLARVWFLKNYGLFGKIPNWYNGFVFFSHYPLLFYLISLIFYKILKDLLFSFYLSILFVFSLGFLICLCLGKIFGNKKKFILLFIALISNPFFIYFIITGRVPEMLSWVFFPLVFVITWKIFKEKKLNFFNFILLTIFLSLILLSHPFVYIISVLTIFCSFLFVKNKIKMLLVSSVFLSFLLTSFWLYFFIKANLNPLGGISSWGPNILYRLLPTSVFCLSLFLFFKKNRKDSKFFIPVLLLAILFVIYVIDIIPVLNYPFLTTYGILFIFLSYFLLLKINTKSSKIIVVLLNLIFTLINIYGLQTSKGFLLKNHPEYYQMAIITLSLPNNTRFVVLPELYVSREFSIYSFAAIYKNLSTPFGQYPQIANKELIKLESELNSSFTVKNCEMVKNISEILDFNFIVSRDEFCDSCFNITLRNNRACVLNIN